MLICQLLDSVPKLIVVTYVYVTLFHAARVL